MAKHKPQVQQPDVVRVSPAQTQPQSVTTSLQISSEQYSGPLPHPDDFARYNQILPGAGERILAMAEEEGRHRRKTIEKFQSNQMDAVKLDKRAEREGRIFGLVAVGLVLGSAVLLGPIAGGIIGGTTLIGLASVFVISHVKQMGSPRIEAPLPPNIPKVESKPSK